MYNGIGSDVSDKIKYKSSSSRSKWKSFTIW